MISTWRASLTETLKRNGECWEDIISVNIKHGDYAEDYIKTLTPEELLDCEQDFDYGGDTDIHLLAWTTNFVYFSYDSFAYVERVPRNPTTDKWEAIIV